MGAVSRGGRCAGGGGCATVRRTGREQPLQVGGAVRRFVGGRSWGGSGLASLGGGVGEVGRVFFVEDGAVVGSCGDRFVGQAFFGGVLAVGEGLLAGHRASIVGELAGQNSWNVGHGEPF